MTGEQSIVVTPANLPFAKVLAQLLAARGSRVVTTSRTFQDAAEASAEFTSSGHGISGIVHICGTAASFAERKITATDPADWDLAAESILRQCLITLQAAFAAFAGGPGSVVVITPTLGMVGVAGLVPLASAIEGARAMTKSAARQWGDCGITANLLAVPLSILHPQSAHLMALQSPPAVGHPPDLERDVVSAVEMLLSSQTRGISGSTIVVDGGTVMVP